MSMKPSTSKQAVSVGCTSESAKTNELCIAKGCTNMAVSHSEWDNEYCSVDCCYNHCQSTFKAWLVANREAKANSASPDQGMSTSKSN